MSNPPDKEFKKLINDLVTECTRCKCEIRLTETSYELNPPILCRKCRRLPQLPRHDQRA